MNAIREIKKVTNSKVEIELPNIVDGKEVEIIVLTNSNISNVKSSKPDSKKSVRKFAGILHKYAKPELIPFEKDAWSIAVKEKYSTKKIIKQV